MANKPLLNTTNPWVLKEIMKALKDFDLDPDGEQIIDEKIFTQKSLLKELKRQKISIEDLPKLLEIASINESSIQNQDDLPTASVPNINTLETKDSSDKSRRLEDPTTNIDKRDKDKFFQQQKRQAESIRKQRIKIAKEVKKAYKIKDSSQHADKVEHLVNIAIQKSQNDPKATPKSIADDVSKLIKENPLGIVPKNPNKAATAETNLTDSLSSQESFTQQKTAFPKYTQEEKLALWTKQFSSEVSNIIKAEEVTNPAIKLVNQAEVKNYVVSALQKTITSTKIGDINSPTMPDHISQVIRLAAQQKTTSGSIDIASKAHASAAIAQKLDHTTLNIGLQIMSESLKDLSPDLFPSGPLNPKKTSLGFNQFRTIRPPDRRPSDPPDFSYIVERINYESNAPQQRSIFSFFKHIFSPTKTGFFSNSPSRLYDVATRILPENTLIPQSVGGKMNISSIFSDLKGIGGGGGLPNLTGGLKNLLKLGGKGAGEAGATLGKSALTTGAAATEGMVGGAGTAAAAAGSGAVLPAILIILVFLLFVFIVSDSPNLQAQLVPTGVGGGITQTGAQYLSLTKIVDQKKLKNNASTSLNYTYEISPVKDPVTITNISDEVIIYSKSGQKKINLTDQTPKTENDTFTSPTYSFPINNYNDSVVSNTITINFTTSTGIKESVYAVATTLIGNPTLVGCPQVWPTDSGYKIVQGPRGNYSHESVEAIDISLPNNNNVYSVQSGVVKFTGWYTRWPIYGKSIIIESTLEDGTKYQHWYNHLNVVLVSAGELVGPGQVIAKSGDTANGRSGGTPEHLHFEYRDGSGAVGFPYAQCPLPGVDPNQLYKCNDELSCNAKVP